MNRRKLEALRALAERPGTEAEGIVAREMLARLEAKRGIPTDEVPAWKLYDELMRGNLSTQEFVDGLKRWTDRQRDESLPETWKCACGKTLLTNEVCTNVIGHLAIQDAIRAKFKRGDRVYYNKWAYTPNCPGTVAAWVKLNRPNGNHPWAWISVRFDHLKSARQVPIYTVKGWHLSHEPIDRETLIRTDIGEGTNHGNS